LRLYKKFRQQRRSFHKQRQVMRQAGEFLQQEWELLAVKYQLILHLGLDRACEILVPTQAGEAVHHWLALRIRLAHMGLKVIIRLGQTQMMPGAQCLCHRAFARAGRAANPVDLRNVDVCHLRQFYLHSRQFAYSIRTSYTLVIESRRKMMAEKSNAQKLLIKEGYRVLFLHPPANNSALLGELPADVEVMKGMGTPVDLALAYIVDRKELEKHLAELKAVVKPGGLLWIAYYKGTSKTKTDINRDSINAYAQSFGLQGVAMISMDDDWSALRLKPLA